MEDDFDLNEIQILHSQCCYHLTYSVSCVTSVPFINPLSWDSKVSIECALPNLGQNRCSRSSGDFLSILVF